MKLYDTHKLHIYISTTYIFALLGSIHGIYYTYIDPIKIKTPGMLVNLPYIDPIGYRRCDSSHLMVSAVHSVGSVQAKS